MSRVAYSIPTYIRVSAVSWCRRVLFPVRHLSAWARNNRAIYALAERGCGFPKTGSCVPDGGTSARDRLSRPRRRCLGCVSRSALRRSLCCIPAASPCRFNRKTRNVELKSSKHTEDASALQKTADFIQAFMLGFEVQVGGVGRAGGPLLFVERVHYVYTLHPRNSRRDPRTICLVLRAKQTLERLLPAQDMVCGGTCSGLLLACVRRTTSATAPEHPLDRFCDTGTLQPTVSPPSSFEFLLRHRQCFCPDCLLTFRLI